MLTSKEQRELLQKLLDKHNLTQLELVGLFDEAYKQSSDVLLTATLVALKAKGESVDDIFSIVRWLQNNMITIPNAPKNAIDICGTGGDLFSTFNISTAAAFVIAKAGISVIKNGGQSNQGRAGSSDVLSALNVPLCETPEDCGKVLQYSNLAFLDAPSFHPMLATFRFARKKLGLPTILNIAAPIANPAHVTRQVVGVYRKDLVRTVADVLYKTNHMEHALVVCGGIDEITTCGLTSVAEIKSNGITYYYIEPRMFELRVATPEEIRGGNAEDNAKIIEDVLSGIMGPYADIVALNAGAGIYVSGYVTTLRDGVFIAKEILASGDGLKKLEQVRIV